MFRFANSELLWLLWLVPLYLLLQFYLRYRRRRNALRLASTTMLPRLMPYVSVGRFWWRSLLFALALLFLILGLARPQFGLKQATQKRTGVELMIALDVSRSMLAQDVKPNRLERAKLEIAHLVQNLKEDRIGLILFAGRAYVQLPITSDYASAQMFLSQVNCDMVSEQGTQLGEALELAMKSFSPQNDVGRAILVISDGENHEGDPLQRAEEAAKQGIRIFTLGLGSPEGAPIPEQGGGMKKDASGNVVISKLDEVTLSQIAAQTGGIYMRAASLRSGLKPILDQIESMQQAEFDQVVYTAFDEQFQLAFLLSFLFFVFSQVLFERKHPWFNLDKLLGGKGSKA